MSNNISPIIGIEMCILIIASFVLHLSDHTVVCLCEEELVQLIQILICT